MLVPLGATSKKSPHKVAWQYDIAAMFSALVMFTLYVVRVLVGDDNSSTASGFNRGGRMTGGTTELNVSQIYLRQSGLGSPHDPDPH